MSSVEAAARRLDRGSLIHRSLDRVAERFQALRAEPYAPLSCPTGSNACVAERFKRFVSALCSVSPNGAWRILFILALTLLAYSPSLRAGFIWDDDHHVTRAGLQSLHGLGRIWWDLGATQQYYPVLHSAFWLEHRLWGGAPLGYHLLNILLHGTAAVLFFSVLRRLAIPGALLAALLFALHPVGVESVAWISEQKNTLSAVFYLGAALAYLRFDRERNADPKQPRAALAAYLTATVLFILAVLTKSVTATLPAALLVILWWQHRRPKTETSLVSSEVERDLRARWQTPRPLRRNLIPLLPWFLIAAAAGLLTAWIEQHYVGAEGESYALSAGARLVIAGHAIWFYLGTLLWPAHLLFIYPRWVIGNHPDWQYAYPTAASALIIAACRRTRAPLAAVLLFAGTLFPALGFFNVYPFVFSFVADHFQYLASLAPLALAAAVAARFADHPAEKPLILAVLAVLGTLTWRQCRVYRDAETLYRTTLAGNPACWMAHNNLGLILADSGRLPEAIEHFTAALGLRPVYPICHYNLGNALRAEGRLADAIGCYESALREQPSDPEAENNLAATLVAAGRQPAAIAHYAAALRLRPGYSDALVGLSAAELQIGRLADAIAAAQTALQVGADEAAARTNLGNALLRAGRTGEAIGEYQAVVKLQPQSADAYFNLANGLVHAGRLADAIAPLQTAIALRPDFALARANLRAVQQRLGLAQ